MAIVSEPFKEEVTPLKTTVSIPLPNVMLSFPASPFIVSLPFPEIIWSSELVPIRVSSESLPDMAKEKLLCGKPPYTVGYVGRDSSQQCYLVRDNSCCTIIIQSVQILRSIVIGTAHK